MTKNKSSVVRGISLFTAISAVIIGTLVSVGYLIIKF